MTSASGSATPDGQTDPFVHTRTNYQIVSVVSAVGSAMGGLATAFVVYDRSKSVLATAMVLILGNLPTVALAPVSARLLERYGSAKVYSWGSLALCLVTLYPAVLAATDRLTVAHLFIWQFSCGIVYGLGGASSSMLTRRLAAPGRVPEFNAQLGRARALATLLGLLLGGVVYEALGPVWVFTIDALSYLGAPVVLIPMMGRLGPLSQSRRKVGEGVQAIRESIGLRAVVVAGGFMALLAAPIGSLLPEIARKVGSSSHLLSFLMAAFAFGGLFVAFVIRVLHDRSRWSVVSRTSVVVAGIGLLLIAALQRTGDDRWVLFVATIVTLVPIGLALAVMGAVIGSLVQVGAPTELRSPVLTVYGVITSLVAPISGFAFGLLADKTHVWVPLAVLGVAFLAFVGLGTDRRLFRHLDQLDGGRSATSDAVLHLHAGRTLVGLFHLHCSTVELMHPVEEDSPS